MEEGFALRNVRVWFSKDKQARFISHLDLNRCVIRAINAAGIKIWHTEGFNPHPFITFALPLQLGIRGRSESFDMRLLEECDDIVERMNEYLPEGIRVISVEDPVRKPRDIVCAKYEVMFENISKDVLERFFAQPEISVEKKTKSGVKMIDLKECISDLDVEKLQDKVKVSMILPAGNTYNVSPMLVVKALEDFTEQEFWYDVTKLEMYTKDKNIWR